MKTKTVILSVLFAVLNVLPANAQEEDIIVIDEDEDTESDGVSQTSPQVLELNPIDICRTAIKIDFKDATSRTIREISLKWTYISQITDEATTSFITA